MSQSAGLGPVKGNGFSRWDELSGAGRREVKRKAY